MQNTYKTLGCKMSLKVYFLASHLNFFHKNMRDVFDEHGEQFHQDISVIENWYKGTWSSSMFGLQTTVGRYIGMIRKLSTNGVYDIR